MSTTTEVDALDLSIVDAVQHEPRASWQVVGSLVGLSDVAVARRWARMESEKLAWTGIALHPSASRGAFIEMRCHSARLDRLIGRLSAHPDVITVGSTTGDFNLFCIVVGASLRAVLNRVEYGMPETQDCEQIRVSLFQQITGGVDWRQEILERESKSPRHRVPDVSPTELQRGNRPLRQSAVAPDHRFRRLFLALGSDGRRTLKDLAQELEASPSTVRRMLQRLLDQRQITFRCDMARPAFDYPIAMVLSLKSRPEHAEELAFHIGSWQETRFCASVASTANLVVVAALRDLLDGQRIMAKLAGLPMPIEVVQRSVNTRMFKVYGRILDAAGRGVKHIPVDPWAADSLEMSSLQEG